MQLIKISLFCLIAQFAWGQQKGEYGLNPVQVGESVGEFEISDMPRVRSQDSLGICYSFAAATLLDRQTCVDNPDKIKKCSEMPDNFRVSPIDMARFASMPEEGKSRDVRDNYSGISESGKLDLTLINALEAGSIASEACAPFYQIVANNPDPVKREEIERNFWQRLRHLYEKSKAKPGCSDCEIETATAIDNFRKDFALKSTNEEILRAFGQDTFAKFLDKALIPEDCNFAGLAETNPKYKVKIYPPADLPRKPGKQYDDSYEKLIGQIKTILKEKKVPMGLNFCAQQGPLTFKSLKECSPKPDETSSVTGFGHSLVISGYRKICKTKNPENCYEALKVENSWGQQWQDDNNKGWVDAKELLKRSFFAKASLTWLEKRAQ
ncbi:hypothetical protein AZI86_07030 [Bdellovibrio bacteriovorus]|uniref:Peptidase C1A papain C-terminal domain-containing protein n=1 Tax=Bdellovibrio bacteriovorus TaxID=959 RepID=A0A150WR46_BDEBC|nr:hypothetical protein [Bdellovibrio bacteriovorus]KYG66787.1 hypothetical protein AZI86_07030 [Bdellovibrio bacteriovorus]